MKSVEQDVCAVDHADALTKAGWKNAKTRQIARRWAPVGMAAYQPVCNL